MSKVSNVALEEAHEKNKWNEIENGIREIDNIKILPSSEAGFEILQRQIELKLLLSIAKNLDLIYNHGIIAYDKP